MTYSVGVLGLLACAVSGIGVGELHAQDTGPTPLSAFGDRMVGTWEAEDSKHVFEWGVGERVLKSHSYFSDNEDWVLVSEGMWYWDPGVESIRGVTVAIGMPVELFEYTSRIAGREVVHDLVSHGEMGGRYVERWLFTDDGYDWALEQDGERVMGGSFQRVR